MKKEWMVKTGLTGSSIWFPEVDCRASGMATKDILSTIHTLEDHRWSLSFVHLELLVEVL